MRIAPPVRSRPQSSEWRCLCSAHLFELVVLATEAKAARQPDGSTTAAL